MNRENILAAIRATKPAPSPLPDPVSYPRAADDVVALFEAMVIATGGRVLSAARREEIAALVNNQFPDAERLVSTIAVFPSGLDVRNIADPRQLESVDVAVLPALLGVAENGALWLTEKECIHRVLPFITQHLVLVLDPADIVPTMHDAYQRIDIADTGFGVFIAGPSKTADIEQALVIGAQGARSLTVVMGDLVIW